MYQTYTKHKNLYKINMTLCRSKVMLSGCRVIPSVCEGQDDQAHGPTTPTETGT